jgi:hypothetical protein
MTTELRRAGTIDWEFVGLVILLIITIAIAIFHNRLQHMADSKYMNEKLIHGR